MATFKPNPRDNEAARRLKESGPPCAKCKPEILESNLIPFEILGKCMTSDGLRPESLEATMRIFGKRYGIDEENKDEIADRVLAMSGQVLKQLNIKRKAQQEELKNKSGGQRKFRR